MERSLGESGGGSADSGCDPFELWERRADVSILTNTGDTVEEACVSALSGQAGEDAVFEWFWVLDHSRGRRCRHLGLQVGWGATYLFPALI